VLLELPAREADWPVVRIEQRRIEVGRRPTRVDDERAEFPLVGGGRAIVDRRRGVATFHTPHPLDDDELAHPYLAVVAWAYARWLGRPALHAGAFLAEGGAWALVGRQEGGKSTLLAGLALAGHPVVADDILILDHGEVLAGPRCIDLRDDAQAELGVAELDPVRSGSRGRLVLPSVPAHAALRGVIFLAWSDAIEAIRLSPAERLRRLAERPGLSEPSPVVPLELARLPAWELRRPRRWDLLAAVRDRLLELTGG